MGTDSESAHRAEGPTVSVVVASCNTPLTLERCLASVSRQPAVEILVMDCSDRDPAASLAARFPGVVFRHFAERRSIPELRREGINASKGAVVALTESWMEPCPGWVAALREAHRRYPDVPAIGGPVAFPCGGANTPAATKSVDARVPAAAGVRVSASRLEWADYFSEYGEYIPRAGEVPGVLPAEKLTGANCSYKRWAVEVCRELVEQASWEHAIHNLLLERGHQLRIATEASVCYRRPAGSGELLRHRFAHGRGHGAKRFEGAPAVERLARGAAAPLVPWVLLWRAWRGLPPARGLKGRLLGAAGWILALNAAWALGEAAGAWFGAGRDEAPG